MLEKNTEQKYSRDSKTEIIPNFEMSQWMYFADDEVVDWDLVISCCVVACSC